MTKGVAVAPDGPVGTAMPFGRHLRRTARLAGPVILARAGLLVMVAIDSAMLGHYGTLSLALYAAANAAQVVMILIGVGLLQGTTILVAQAHGARDAAACGAYWRVSFVHGVFLGVVMGLICLLGRWTLEATGQEPEVAAGGGRVLVMIAWGSPALFMWVVCTHFLEGISRPIPGMLVMFAAVLVNVLLNWVFIFGNLGGPEMGAEGAAIATSLVRWFMFAALFIFLIRLPDARTLGIHTPVADFWAISKRLRRLGYPLGAARGLETAAFAALVMLAGHLGTTSLAAYQIGYNLIGLVFMVAIGTAAASMIRVGNAVGRRNPTDITRAGWAGVLLIACLMACFAGPFLGLGLPLAKPLHRRPSRAASCRLAHRHLRYHPGVRRDAGGADGRAARSRRRVGAAGAPAHRLVVHYGAHRLRAGLRGRYRRRRPDVGHSGGCALRQYPAVGPLPRRGPATDRPLLRGLCRSVLPVWRPKMATVGP